MRSPIDGRVDLDNLAFKHAARISHRPDFNRLTYLKQWAVAFEDISDHPFGRDIGNSVGRRRLSRLYLKSRRGIDRRHLTSNRTTDLKFPFTWTTNGIKRLPLLNLVSKFRQCIDDHSFPRREDLRGQVIVEVKLVIEIDVTDALLFNSKRVIPYGFDSKCAQLVGRQVHAVIGLGRIGASTRI